MNIRGHLLENYLFKQVEGYSDKWATWENHPTFILEDNLFEEVNIRLVLTDTALVLLGDGVPKENISSFIGADFVIFASRHKAESGIPALLCHSTGNWSQDTSFGGEPQTICHMSARLLRIAFQNLVSQNTQAELEWVIDLEVNHHGPTQFDFPLIFMELGSSKVHWNHEGGGGAVADAIINTIYQYMREVAIDLSELPEEFTRSELYDNVRQKENPVCIGFGGVHYARNFSKLLDRTSLSFIIPKYYVPSLTEDLLEQMINNTLEPVHLALIDWNSMKSATRLELIGLLDKKGIKWKKRKLMKSKSYRQIN